MVRGYGEIEAGLEGFVLTAASERMIMRKDLILQAALEEDVGQVGHAVQRVVVRHAHVILVRQVPSNISSIITILRNHIENGIVSLARRRRRSRRLMACEGVKTHAEAMSC